MVKKQLIYTVIISASLLIGATFFEAPSNENGMGQVIFPELGFSFQVEIAETKKQRAQGLMHRRFMALDKGMLFIFAKEEIQKVWMKGTLIELDVVFISEAGVVVSTVKGLKPCRKEPCKVYSSNKKAKYMLELNAGLLDKAGVRVAQKFILDRVSARVKLI